MTGRNHGRRAAYENFETHVENALQYNMNGMSDVELSMSFETGQVILGSGEH